MNEILNITSFKLLQVICVIINQWFVTGGAFHLPGTLGNVWRDFWLSGLDGNQMHRKVSPTKDRLAPSSSAEVGHYCLFCLGSLSQDFKNYKYIIQS